MIGNFKLVRKISLNLPMYSSLPITFENVYIDRFNSIFKGFYLLVSADDISVDNIGLNREITFRKVRSTERFGAGLNASDIISASIVPKQELSDDQLRIINYLNKVIDSKYYNTVE